MLQLPARKDVVEGGDAVYIEVVQPIYGCIERQILVAIDITRSCRVPYRKIPLCRLAQVGILRKDELVNGSKLGIECLPSLLGNSLECGVLKQSPIPYCSHHKQSSLSLWRGIVAEGAPIVQGWFLGSEAGNSLANVLLGEVNPSGKLPFTFPVRLQDNSAHAVGEYGGSGKVEYKEGLLVGYRWHDTKGIAPLFAFGHGLSYTTFEYSNARLSSKSIREGGKVSVEVTVTNSGERDGAEVVQLYVGDDQASVLRPAKELKGFEKVWLKAGESKRVKLEVPYEALCFFDDEAHAWRAEKGMFTLSIGSASNDIRATLNLELK